MDSEVAALIERHVSAAEATPDSARAHGTLGLVYEANGLYPEAKTCFDNAYRLEPENPLWAHHAMLCLWSNGDVVAARAMLQDLVKAHPDFGPAWQRLGHAALQAGDLAEAARAFDKCRDLSPSRPYGEVGLAEVHLRKREYAEAAALLEKAVSCAPTDGTAHYLLGQAHRGLGRRDDAQVELGRGQGAKVEYWQDPLSRTLGKYRCGPAARVERATRLSSASQFGQAAKILEKELTQYPDDPLILNNLAFAYNSLYRFDEALPLLQRALDVDDADVTARMTLMATLLALRRAGDALPHAHRVLELAPNDGQAHYAVAHVYMALEDWAKVRAELTQAVQLGIENADVHMNLVRACMELDDFEQAREHLGMVLRDEPEHLDAYLVLCQVCIRLGDRDGAAKALTEARRIDPTRLEIKALADQLRDADGGTSE